MNEATLNKSVRRVMASQPTINREWGLGPIALARSTAAEKPSPLSRWAECHPRHSADAPTQLVRPQAAVTTLPHAFWVPMDTPRCRSLGQITSALFEVGEPYRRSA
jgi:methylmalonyl-CoA mutase